MTRNEFMFQLRTKLKRLPQSDAEDAVAYYQGYFDDAGPENEQEVIKELGSPSEVAGKIIREFAFKQLENQPDSKKGMGPIGWVVLIVLASPIALPVGIAILAVFFAVIVSVLGILLGLGAAGLVAAAVGIFSAVVGMTSLVSDPASTLYYVGRGMIALGFGAAILWVACWLARMAVVGISRLTAKWMNRRSDK